jgi:hypothetical protein
MHHGSSLRLDSEELCILGGSCVTISFMACYDLYPVELCAARGCLSLLFFKYILFNTCISSTACDNVIPVQ